MRKPQTPGAGKARSRNKGFSNMFSTGGANKSEVIAEVKQYINKELRPLSSVGKRGGEVQALRLNRFRHIIKD